MPPTDELLTRMIKPNILALLRHLNPVAAADLLQRRPGLLLGATSALVEFLESYGLQGTHMGVVLHAVACWGGGSDLSAATVHGVGQVLLALQDLGFTPEEVIHGQPDSFVPSIGTAVLSSGATPASVAASTSFLSRRLGFTSRRQLADAVLQYPAVLACDVVETLEPRLALLEALGRAGEQQLLGAYFTPDSGWLLGLASWDVHIAPKLGFLQQLVGDNQAAAQQLLVAFPALLRLSVEHRLRPAARMLRSAGFSEAELAALLLSRPQVLAVSLDALADRLACLINEAGASAADLAAYPACVLLPLLDVVGPRCCFARQKQLPGIWATAAPSSSGGDGGIARGRPDLRALLEPSQDAFLAAAAAALGVSQGEAAAEYERLGKEWARTHYLGSMPGGVRWQHAGSGGS